MSIFWLYVLFECPALTLSIELQEIDPAPGPTFGTPAPALAPPYADAEVDDPAGNSTATDVQRYQKQLIGLLNVNPALATRPKHVDICLAYSKYQGFLQAQTLMFRMIDDGDWPIRQPTSDELIKVFVSKSVWHASYRPYFPRALAFPELIKWLEKHSDAPSNMDVFGVVKQLYTFSEFKVVLGRLERSAGKSVEKSAERSLKKGKGKRDRDRDSEDSEDGGSKKKKRASKASGSKSRNT